MILDELEHPIVQAPMAGGPSTPELAAAVCGAGGLGFLAAGYRTADQVREDVRALRAATSNPFGVNVFVPGRVEPDEAALSAYVQRLGEEAARSGAELGEPRYDDDAWDAKLALLEEDPVPVVSFTFGCPPPDVVASLRSSGSEVWVTVTSPDEARIARDAGADALVLQGVEAGGHRATFIDGVDEGLSTLALLRLAARGTDLPLVVTGGITDGAGVAAVLAAGAAAAQLGTAFMLSPEAGTHPLHRAELALDTPTALTRAFTGRNARGLVNRFLVEHSANAPSAYPHVHHVTAPLRAAARERGDADVLNLWAGQAHALAREMPAADIVRSIGLEARRVLGEAAGRGPD